VLYGAADDAGRLCWDNSRMCIQHSFISRSHALHFTRLLLCGASVLLSCSDWHTVCGSDWHTELVRSLLARLVLAYGSICITCYITSLMSLSDTMHVPQCVAS
jgi:hypothetical protein